MSDSKKKVDVVSLATNEFSKTLVFSNFNGGQRDPDQCEVQLRSGTFSFEGTFYFENLSEFTSSIGQMAEGKYGIAELREDHRNQFIRMELSESGDVVVIGIMEQHREFSQSLTFGFKTDQTCLALFARDLRKVL